jgi:hypothetical protein
MSSCGNREEALTKFQEAAEFENISLCEELCINYNFTKEEVLQVLWFDDLCMTLYLIPFSVVKWIWKYFSFSKKDFSGSPIELLFIAKCGIGNLEYVEWLYENFEIPKENAISKENEAFRKCCGLGHIEMAKWFHNTFRLTKKEAIKVNNYAFNSACIGGFIEVCEWLRTTFDLKKEDLGSISIENNTYLPFNHILFNLFYSKKYDMITYLFNIFDLNEEHARFVLPVIPEKERELFVSLCVPFGSFVKPANN